jgi:DNA-binding phage protein
MAFEAEEVIRLLRDAVKREGSQLAFARKTGFDRSNLNQVLAGKRPVTDSILKALKLRIVFAPE